MAMGKQQGRMRRVIGLGLAGILMVTALSTVALGASGTAEPATKDAGTETLAVVEKTAAKEGVSAKKGADKGSAAWTIEANCLACHVNEEKAFEDEKCLASKHTALECTTCHADEKGLTKGHKKAKEGVAEVKRLKKSEVDEQTCLNCHKQEDLVKATAKQDVLTDKEGTVVNPHDLPDVVEHQGVSCASCHYMHRDKTALEAAPAVCDGCHHDGVYKCFTCHA